MRQSITNVDHNCKTLLYMGKKRFIFLVHTQPRQNRKRKQKQQREPTHTNTYLKERVVYMLHTVRENRKTTLK